MIDLHAARPEYLWLLLLLPVVWFAARRLRSIEKGRRVFIVVLRTLIVLLLVLALSRLELARHSRDLTVYFLLDQSDSIPPAIQESATQLVRQMAGTKKRDDEAGLIAFGGNASIESLAINTFEFDGSVNSVVDGVRTDISSALRLALGAFPNNRMRRVVLLTDGNENAGSALEVARLAKNSGVPVDVVPLRYDQRADVQIDKLIVPQRTTKDTPFDIKVFLSSQTNARGRLRLYEDDRIIIDQDVEVSAGKNTPLVLPRRLEEGGFHRYRATIEVAGDARPQNNTAQAFTDLKADPRVLYVEGDQVSTNFLKPALELEKIRVDAVDPSGIPLNIEDIQSYDTVILSNVHANEMTYDQMAMIDRAVHDLGIGLVMIGGENSFGAGGYQDSPIEKALPVSMDVKQKKVLPNGALVIVLHTCEIPQGNSWAREISLAALNVLSAQDYFGLLYYGSKQGIAAGGMGGWGEYWCWEPGLQMTGDKRAMRSKIRGVQPMDMPTFDPTLELAYQELKKVKTEAKHIVVISDGDPAPPNQTLVNNIRDEGITVSSVAIAPHHGQTVTTLQDMAYWGAGNFYYPKTSRELPRIFIKEASIVRRSLIFEEPFFPKSDTYSEVMEGFAELPQLTGYVVTSDKELATIALRTEKDDPLLAHWRYGLGKSVAFTSDAKNKWASAWVDWDGYGKFWSQVVRWSLRETSSNNFQVNTELKGGKGVVTIDAVDIDGNFENFLDFETTVISPGAKEEDTRKIEVRQVGPGRYQGTFDAPDVGTYMISMNTGEGEEMRQVVAGASMSYSPEYEASRSNEEFMEKIAKESGGRMAGGEGYDAFSRDLPKMARPKPVWEWLLLAGLLLVPVDVFVRRVYLDWAELLAAALKLFRRRKVAEERTEGMGSLLAAKGRATAEFREEKKTEERDARKEFRERLQQAETDAPPPQGGSVFDKPAGGDGAPARHREKQTYSADSSARPTGGGSLSDLKKAKERAKKKM